MDIVDKLKSSHSLLGDPLHREAWEKIEELRHALEHAADTLYDVGAYDGWTAARTVLDGE